MKSKQVAHKAFIVRKNRTVHIMTSLVEKLGIIVGQAFAANDLPEELGRVKVSDRPDLCQFQCNGAMAAAKIARKNPREVAGMVMDALKDRTELSHLDIAGPGFINIDVSDDYLAGHLKEISSDERAGIPRTERGQPSLIMAARMWPRPCMSDICALLLLAIRCAASCRLPAIRHWAMCIWVTGARKWA